MKRHVVKCKTSVCRKCKQYELDRLFALHVSMRREILKAAASGGGFTLPRASPARAGQPAPKPRGASH